LRRSTTIADARNQPDDLTHANQVSDETFGGAALPHKIAETVLGACLEHSRPKSRQITLENLPAVLSANYPEPSRKQSLFALKLTRAKSWGN
jgi:hypothetical protein